MSDNKFLLTGVGRIVQGDVFKGQDTDAEGRPLVIKNGLNAGQPRLDYFIGVAIPKTDPGVNELIQEIRNAAKGSFPALFDASGNCANPRFAFKYTDGDSNIPNTKGVAPCTREGFPGHYVFNFSSGFVPKAYTTGGAAQIVNPDEIKRGYYVRVYGSVRGNGSQQQPGVFLNHSMVELVGYGDEITTGPVGTDVFGGAPVSLPVGASATPTTSAPPLAIPAASAGIVPAPAASPAAPITPAPVAVVPAPEFLNPPAPAPAPVAEPVPVQTYTMNGVNYSRQQLIDAGWNDTQIATLPTA